MLQKQKSRNYIFLPEKTLAYVMAKLHYILKWQLHKRRALWWRDSTRVKFLYSGDFRDYAGISYIQQDYMCKSFGTGTFFFFN